MKPNERFFYDNAGYCYNPLTETAEQGKTRCAKALAAAELEGKAAGLWFDWRQDDEDSSSFTDEQPAWPLWLCHCRNERGQSVGCVGGVDLGRVVTPWNRPAYCRVIEAELAAEAITNNS